VCSILVGDLKFRMENFTNRPLEGSTASYREGNENFEPKRDRIWHSETETRVKNQNMLLDAAT
jgi:hypothetical protein